MTCSTLLTTTRTSRSKEKNGETEYVITALGYKNIKNRQGNKGMLFVLGTISYAPDRRLGIN